MKKIFKFLQKNKYAIVWTGCYVAIMWAILKFMFNFDMFSVAQWNVLVHAQLHGFPGFVFGILILAALPLYIATTMVVVRTGKPLIKLSVPKFMTPVAIDDGKKKDDAAPVVKTEPKPDDKKIIPTELQAAFDRARVHGGAAAPKSVFDIGNMMTQKSEHTDDNSVPELQPSDALPLPNDFDLSVGDAVPSFTPVFSDMDFEVEDTDDDVMRTHGVGGAVGDFLTDNGVNFNMDGDVVLTARDAIAVHNDPDFWVADDDAWFANGNQKTSPIANVLDVAAAHGLRPVLYLGATNIMDLDARRAAWKSMGVTVITDLNDLLTG